MTTHKADREQTPISQSELFSFLYEAYLVGCQILLNCGESQTVVTIHPTGVDCATNSRLTIDKTQ